MKKTRIAPSILSADFSNLAAGVAAIDASLAEWVHLDVMDGNFVPNLTFGAKMVADLRPHSRNIFDAHLMTAAPERLIEDFAAAGADYITIHAETAVHSHRILETIRRLGKKAGLGIVPATGVAAIEPLLPFIDLILVMTVNPGFGGQAFIPQCLEKVKALNRLREGGAGDFLISVDGGINPGTAAAARSAGADVLVTGSVFFNTPDKAALVRELRGSAG